jgi:hypothetical protein
MAWVGYYSYAKYIGVKFDEEILSLFNTYVLNIPFIIPFGGICFVSRNCKSVHWDNEKLHNENGYAVEFAGDYGMHCLYGIRIKGDNFKKAKGGKMTVADIMAIGNTEERYALLRWKPEILLSEATLVDTKEKEVEVKYIEFDGKEMVLAGEFVRHGDLIFKHKGTWKDTPVHNKAKTKKRKRVNKLYSIDNSLFNRKKYFVQKVCPSTDRVYYEWVGPNIASKGNADECVAWQCHLTLDQYDRLYAET